MSKGEYKYFYIPYEVPFWDCGDFFNLSKHFKEGGFPPPKGYRDPGIRPKIILLSIKIFDPTPFMK
jgi:hypothetical protein